MVTGLSIFTQVARGWGFWESEGRRFIKRPPRFGSETPAALITRPRQQQVLEELWAAEQWHRLLDPVVPVPSGPRLLGWMATTSVHAAQTDMPVPRASARLTAPHPGRSGVSPPPSKKAVDLPHPCPSLSSQGQLLHAALWLYLPLLGHLVLCRPFRRRPGFRRGLQVQ